MVWEDRPQETQMIGEMKLSSISPQKVHYPCKSDSAAPSHFSGLRHSQQRDAYSNAANTLLFGEAFGIWAAHIYLETRATRFISSHDCRCRPCSTMLNFLDLVTQHLACRTVISAFIAIPFSYL